MNRTISKPTKVISEYSVGVAGNSASGMGRQQRRDEGKAGSRHVCAESQNQVVAAERKKGGRNWCAAAVSVLVMILLVDIMSA